MYFVGPPPAQRRRVRPVLPADESEHPEPVPGYRSVLALERDSVASSELCEDASGRLAIVTMGHTPLALGTRIGYLDWLERLAGIAEHPYVADVLAGGVTSDHRPYLAVPAGIDTLAGRLWVTGSAPADVVQELGVGLAEALSLAHDRALLHGAVRPACVLIDDTGKPRLAGFDNTAPGLGRPPAISPYTPPELLEMIAAGKPARSTAGDAYALAATLYVTLGGHLPWAEQPATPQRELPGSTALGRAAPLARALRAALSSDPDARPAAGDLGEQLAALRLDGADQAGVPVAAALLSRDGIRVLAAGTGEPAALSARPASGLAGQSTELLPQPAVPSPQPATAEPAERATPAKGATQGEHVTSELMALEPATAELAAIPAVPVPPPDASPDVPPVVVRPADPGPAAVPPDPPERRTGVRGKRPLLVAAMLLAIVLGAGAAMTFWPTEPPRSQAGGGSGRVEEAPSQSLPSLGPGKTAGPASSPPPSRSPSPSRSRRTSAPPSSPPPERERDDSVAALAGRWSEVQPWEDGQSFLKFTSDGHMTLTGPNTCYGRAHKWDNNSQQRTYQLGHNCDQNGYAVIVLSDDGQALAIHWSQNTSDQYARS